VRLGRFSAHVRNALLGGVSPRKLALTFAIGFVVGFLPILWGATLLCAGLAFLFRLNQAGIQAANYLAYPVQIALFVPFYRMGARIFPWGPSLTGEALTKGFKHDLAENGALVFVATLKAVGAWLLIAPPVAILLYLILRPVLTRMHTVQTVRDGYCSRL
jgi:uncharacterized protein (DUF2062 family)